MPHDSSLIQREAEGWFSTVDWRKGCFLGGPLAAKLPGVLFGCTLEVLAHGLNAMKQREAAWKENELEGEPTTLSLFSLENE